jgi:hypothetical protein
MYVNGFTRLWETSAIYKQASDRLYSPNHTHSFAALYNHMVLEVHHVNQRIQGAVTCHEHVFPC